MRRNGLAGATVALVVLAVLAAVMFVALSVLLSLVGLPQWVVSPVAIGATVTAALAVADVYTPLGDTARTTGLRDLPRAKLGGDVALAAVVGGVVGFLGAYVLLSGDGSGLARLVVLSVAVVAGYATFVSRNLAVYRGQAR
ncbi:hypothetical protein [Halobacterium zhouii]|uniref:hypothetical protein n=1 Tax=Halobacterium zhouii TaxID=2902624 RepID=UPI001E5024FE|nr:hypothetical protein [Halobacterium zhouii]